MALLDRDFLARLATLEIVSRRIRRGRLRGERRSSKKGVSVEFADHRPYAIGDDLRFLDWNMYARLDQLMVKLFHDEEDLGVHILLDRSASMDFGDPSKALIAKKVAAAIGYIALLGMNRVSFWSPGEGGDVELRQLRSARSATRLFDVLERAEVGGAVGMDDSLRRWIGVRRPRGVLIVISDFLHPEGSWEFLRPLVRGGLEAHCVRVLTPAEVDPQIEGDLRLVDSEDATHVDISISPRLLRLYHEARENYDNRLDHFCRTRQITLATARTTEPFENLVLEVLRRRGLLR